MRNRFTRPLRAAAVLLAAALGGCEETDTIPPDGSTIDLSATPAQIVLGAGGIQTSPVSILATVRNSIGVPLPDQDVRFTTTNGILDPTAGTPVATDESGNAACTLTGARQGPTITAKAGKASAMLTLTAATGALAQITLSPATWILDDCSDTQMFTAMALEADGDPVDGVSIEFVVTSSGSNSILATFNPNPGVTGSGTNAAGEIKTTWTPNSSDCNSKCATGKSCVFAFVARTVGGALTSNTATMTDAVP